MLGGTLTTRERRVLAAGRRADAVVPSRGLGIALGGGLSGALTRARRSILGGGLGGRLNALDIAGLGVGGGPSLRGLGNLDRGVGFSTLGFGGGISIGGYGGALRLGGGLGSAARLDECLLGGRTLCFQDPIYGHYCEGCFNRNLVADSVMTGIDILDGPCTCECCENVLDFGIDPYQYGIGWYVSP